MNYKEVSKSINNIIKIAEFGISNQRAEGHVVFGMGEDAILFQGDNVLEFKNNVIKLLKANRELSETLSKEEFEKKLISYIREQSLREVNNENIKQFYKSLEEIKVKKSIIFYHLNGVKYQQAFPLELGPYKIYNVVEGKADFKNEYGLDKEFLSDILKHSASDNRSEYLIAVSVNARDNKKAYEKAKILLNQFEDTIRFIIASTNKNYDVGIFNYDQRRYIQSYILNDEARGTKFTREGSMIPVNLEDPHLILKEQGYDKLWDKLKKEKRTILEDRIISSVSWAGKALRDDIPSRVLTQYVFGIEALLQFQGKDNMISPSIVSQMAESSAFIISDDLEGRKEVEKKMRDVYSKRSAVAHGGSVFVNEEIINDALWLLKQLIINFLINKDLMKMKNMEEVTAWIKNKKYGSI